MQAYWEHGNLWDNPMYSCKSNNLTFDQMAARNEKSKVRAVLCFAYGVFVQICYGLSLSVICRKEFRRLSCYKFMMVMGLLDFTCITFSSPLSAYFDYIGSEFCMYPNLTLIAGSSIDAIFNACCMLCLMLVFNRFIDLWKPQVAEMLFQGNRTWIFVGVALLYGLFFFTIPAPVLFNSDYGAWIYHPMINNNMNHQYASIYQTINNIMCSIGISTFYVLIYILHKEKLKKLHVKREGKFQRQILLQATLVCLFTLTTCTIWGSMLFIEPTHLIMHIGHASWLFMHGTPALVYVFINKTIHNRIRGYFSRRSAHSSSVMQGPTTPTPNAFTISIQEEQKEKYEASL